MTSPILTREEAIDRMKDGLPCESRYEEYDWRETAWADFDINVVRFRKPPEPRGVARSWNIYREGWDGPNVQKHETIHVREVLPDEVWVKRMTGTEVEDMAWNVCGYERGSSGADELVTFARALGLIGEGS